MLFETERATQSFERFWAAYPKQTNRQLAVRWWRALDPSPELVDLIVQSVKTQVADRHYSESKFWPDPWKWLSLKRWEDVTIKQPLRQRKDREKKACNHAKVLADSWKPPAADQDASEREWLNLEEKDREAIRKQVRARLPGMFNRKTDRDFMFHTACLNHLRKK